MVKILTWKGSVLISVTRNVSVFYTEELIGENTDIVLVARTRTRYFRSPVKA